jgi:hypothetical protein
MRVILMIRGTVSSIFLFTRTVESRLTDDFKEQGPFVTLDNVMGNPSLAVSKGMFERVEA